MRIEQLEYVAAVARLGSFRAAAEFCHISQPALSETVRNLERELEVHLLDRKQSGATISAGGRELLPHVMSALEAIDNLRRAANEQHRASRTVRVGTVNAATVPLLTPAIRLFHHAHPETEVEVIGAQHAQIHRSILEGSLDLGLVNYLDGDDLSPELETTELLSGRAVVCMQPDNPLALQSDVDADDLAAQPLIVMRSGYVMHRLLYRLIDGRVPFIAYSTDGAEMGKVMVAAGLGVTILPDYSVIGDPLEQHGIITYRPLAHDRSVSVRLVLQRRRSGTAPQAARDLHQMLVKRAHELGNTMAPCETSSP
jgi:DNA-binding transcriptional LysR family regulator